MKSSNRESIRKTGTGKKIWIDLDNSPHVPFFVPIIDELRKRGHEVLLTARNTYQVCDLLEFHKLSCRVIGKHWGRHRLLKALGTCLRAVRLMPIILKEKPSLAVAHGSRSQFLSSIMTGIPTITIYDYEFASGVGYSLGEHWAFTPHYIENSGEEIGRSRTLRYPGLKEDVYVPRLHPDPSVLSSLGLTENDLIATVRPPATEAHYHNPEAEILLKAALDRLMQQPEVKVILLPRNEKQSRALQKDWASWVENRKIIIPEHVVDGLNLIWFSDLVISGGGTMNREAAALGVPVYSIFRGRIGAVDRYLVTHNRLVLIENVEEVSTKIALKKRKPGLAVALNQNSQVLDVIVSGIISIAENGCLPETRAVAHEGAQSCPPQLKF